MQSMVLLWLSERCTEQGMMYSLLEIFDPVSTNRLEIGRWGAPVEPSFTVDHYELNEIWEKGLKPNLESVAEPLLRLVAENLRRQFSERGVWTENNRHWDVASWGRSAIEPHEQDEHPEPIDVLIDAARDCLDPYSPFGSNK